MDIISEFGDTILLTEPENNSGNPRCFPFAVFRYYNVTAHVHVSFLRCFFAIIMMAHARAQSRYNNDQITKSPSTFSWMTFYEKSTMRMRRHCYCNEKTLNQKYHYRSHKFRVSLRNYGHFMKLHQELWIYVYLFNFLWRNVRFFEPWLLLGR